MKESNNEKSGRGRQIVRDFLSKKEREKLYEVSFYSSETLDERYFLHTFSDDVLESIKSLQGKYGMESYCQHLDEIFSEDEFEGCLLSETETITRIDINHPRYEYLFRCFEYAYGRLHSHDLKIEMTDYEYVELVSLCCVDKDLTFNKLRHVNRKLYNSLINRIDRCFCFDNIYDCKYPYFVTIDEAQADAEAIVKEHGELRSGGDTIGYIFHSEE